VGKKALQEQENGRKVILNEIIWTSATKCFFPFTARARPITALISPFFFSFKAVYGFLRWGPLLVTDCAALAPRGAPNFGCIFVLGSVTQ
jgi:hypothetical protein